MDCRGGLFHAGARHNHRQHGLACDGGKPWRKPAAHAAGSGVVLAHDGHADTGVGLAGRPVRHAPRLFRGDSVVRPRLDILCDGAHVAAIGARAGLAGRRWLDAAADRASRRAAHVPRGRISGGARLRVDCGTSRPDDRTGTRWLARASRFVALDLSHQRTYRRDRQSGCAALPAASHQGRGHRHRFRLDRLRLAVGRNGVVHACARSPVLRYGMGRVRGAGAALRCHDPGVLAVCPAPCRPAVSA
ncbi:hypothetical protein LMG16407_03177 [Pandoraea apista]|nr:hypothetical protein LMG16407_03177 [Pandoraea apista]